MDEQAELARFWETRYADADRVWSGRPNAGLVAVAGELAPGRALDLGCGEGADAVWLAQRGWRVTAVDISPTAIARARVAADNAGVSLELVAHDLQTWHSEQSFDLVAASFLHSPVEIARTAILRRAAGLVVPGGHLLVVSHAAFPPWAAHHHEPQFLSPAEEVEALDLGWEVRLAQTRARDAVGPDGEHATIEDVVVLLRRPAA